MVEAWGEEDEEEHVLEANGASDDELEAEYQEAVALTTIAKQRRAEVDRARQFFRKPQSSEDRKAKLDNGSSRNFYVRAVGNWAIGKTIMSITANVKVVNWEETEEQVTEEPHPFPVTTFSSHGRERCATTSGVIHTACARTLAGTRWFEKFEVELKRHATHVEVVPDNETFLFGPWSTQEEFSCSYFPGCSGTERVPLESKPSGPRWFPF